MSEQSLLEFPCDVPIKVFGRNEPEFRDSALDIVRAHWTDLAGDRIAERLSRGGSYLSLTITVHAESRDQLDAVYRALTARREVLMVL